MLLPAVSMISLTYVNSNWSYSGVPNVFDYLRSEETVQGVLLFVAIDIV